VPKLVELGLGWVEEPIWPPEDAAGLRRLREAGLVVAAGECATTPSEFDRLIAGKAIDVLQPSLTKIGGVSALLDRLASTRGAGIRAIPHSYGWGPGYLATARVLAAQPAAIPLETIFLQLAVPAYREFDAQTTMLELSDAPGLGFAQNEDIWRFRVSSYSTGEQA